MGSEDPEERSRWWRRCGWSCHVVDLPVVVVVVVVSEGICRPSMEEEKEWKRRKGDG